MTFGGVGNKPRTNQERQTKQVGFEYLCFLSFCLKKKGDEKERKKDWNFKDDLIGRR